MRSHEHLTAFLVYLSLFLVSTLCTGEYGSIFIAYIIQSFQRFFNILSLFLSISLPLSRRPYVHKLWKPCVSEFQQISLFGVTFFYLQLSFYYTVYECKTKENTKKYIIKKSKEAVCLRKYFNPISVVFKNYKLLLSSLTPTLSVAFYDRQGYLGAILDLHTAGSKLLW